MSERPWAAPGLSINDRIAEINRAGIDGKIITTNLWIALREAMEAATEEASTVTVGYLGGPDGP